MKNYEMINLYNVLSHLLSDQKNLPKKFAYRAARNISILKPVVEAFNSTINIENHPDIVEFNKERQTRFEKICVRDDKGEPVNNNGMYVFKDPRVVDKIMNEIKTKFPGIDKKIQDYNESVEKLSQEEEDVTLLMVKEEDLPDELPANTVTTLLLMISDD